MESDTKVSNLQILARKYIEENDIERIVNEMINSLVHERVKNPLVYMIKFLAGLMSDEERKENGLVIPEPFPKGKPIAKYPYLTKDSLLKKYLTKELFNSIKYSKTKQGGNINQVIKISETLPSDNIGCQITDSDCLFTFKDLFTPIINEYHNIKKDNVYNDIKGTSITSFSFPFANSTYANINKCLFSLSRNIKDSPYEIICSNERREYILTEIKKEIDNQIQSKNLPNMKYIDFKKETSEIWNNILKYINYDNDKNEKLQYKLNYPEKRGIYYTDDYSTIILLNFNEHIQFYSTFDKTLSPNSAADFVKLYNNLIKIEDVIGRKINYDYNKTYGYINSDIRLLGAGFHIYTDITVNNIDPNHTDKSYETVIKDLHFDSYELKPIEGENKTNISLSSYYKLSIPNQIVFIEQFYNDISGLIHLSKSSINEQNKFLFAKHQFSSTKIYNDQHIKSAYDNAYETNKNKISASGLNYNDLISYYNDKPNNEYGIFLQEFTQLKSSTEFIERYLTLSQGYLKKNLFKKNSFNVQLTESNKSQIENINICLIRNIDNYPFANSYIQNNAEIEKVIKTALNNLNLRKHFGNYFSFDVENQKDQASKIIQENNINFYDKDLVIPNRGVIQFDYENVYAIVNDIDHIKFYLNANNPSDKFNEYLFNLLKVLNEFSKHIKFNTDNRFGVVTACPKYLGTGLVINVTIKVKMFKDKIENLNRSINSVFVNEGKINEFSCDIVKDDVNGRVICIRNNVTIGKSENEIFGDLVHFISKILQEEKNIVNSSE